MAKYKGAKDRRAEQEEARQARIKEIMQENEARKLAGQQAAEEEAANNDAMEQEAEEAEEAEEQEAAEQQPEQEGRQTRSNRASNKTSEEEKKKKQASYNKMAQRRAEKFVKNRINRGKTGRVNNQQTGKRVLKDRDVYKKAVTKVPKKVAGETAKQAAKKTGMKAGAKAGAAGGCASTIIIIILLIGILSFIFNMPDEIVGKMTQFLNDKWTGAKIGLGFVPADIAIAEQDLLDTAKYLDSMGYDLVGLGFMEPASLNEAGDPIDSPLSKYYSFTFNGIYGQQYGEVTYQGKVVGNYKSGYFVPNDDELNNAYITGDQKRDVDIINYLNRENNQMEGATQYQGTRTITITERYNKDNNTYEYETVLVKGTDDLYRDEEIVYVKSERLITYLAAEARTYLFNGTHLNPIVEAFKGWFTKDIGMIVLKGKAKEYQEDAHIMEKMTGEYKMSIDRRNKTLFVSSADNRFFDGYRYDMNGWLGKYGKPIEFSLAMHLATMAPDLAYKVANDEEIEAQVKIDLFNGIYSRRVLTSGGEDAQEAFTGKIIVGVSGATFTPTWQGTDEDVAMGYATEPDRTIKGPDLTGIAAIYYSAHMPSIEEYRNGGYRTVEAYIVPSDWQEAYNQIIDGNLSDLSGTGREIIKITGMEETYSILQKIIKYNKQCSNLPLYIPYIYSVEEHWYRDLFFGDPPDLGGYVVKVDEAGAAPVVNEAGFDKIIKAYSDGRIQANWARAKESFFVGQNKYKVNAIFMMAISLAEQSGGTATSSCNNEHHNWYSYSHGRAGDWVTFPANGDGGTESVAERIANRKRNDGLDYFKNTPPRITVGQIGDAYCDPPTNWIKNVTKYMNTFYEYAIENNIPLLDPSTMEEMEDFAPTVTGESTSAMTVYEVVDGPTNVIPLSEIDTYYDEFSDLYIPLPDNQGFQIRETQVYDLKQVREPIQYDNSAHIKEIFGYFDTGILENYKKQEIEDPKTEEEIAKNNEIKKRNAQIDEAYNNNKFRQRVREKARYYTFDGEKRSPERENISPSKESLSAIAILENVKTEDAEHVLKNFKELLSDLNFETEDSTEEDQVTMSEKNKSLSWIFKNYIPTYDWPSQEETPKATDSVDTVDNGLYIYKVSAARTRTPELLPDEEVPEIPYDETEEGDPGEENAEYVDVDLSTLEDSESDFEEGNIVTDYTDKNMIAGFKGGDVLISPTQSKVKAADRETNTLTIEFTGAKKTIKYISRKLNKDNKYELVEEEREEEDVLVKGMSLTIFGIKIDDGIEVGKELGQGEAIGKTIKGTDIGLLLRGQDLSAEESSDKELGKLSVPRYIYPPDKSSTYVPDYIVKTDIMNSAPFTESKEELKAILATYSGKDKKRTNKMERYKNSISTDGKYALDTDEVVDALLYIQKEYKINAIYVASASIFANGGGRAMRFRNNILNIINGGANSNFDTLEAGMDFTGQLFKEQYFAESRYTVTGIRQKWNAWYETKSPPRSQQIVSQMTEFFLQAKEMGYEAFKDFEPPEGVEDLANNGNVVEIAKKLIDYIWKHKLLYNQGIRNVKKFSDEYHAGKKPSQSGLDCSTFVSWVISEATNKKLFYTTSAPASITLGGYAKQYNGKYWKIVSKSNVQPGDILIKPGTHTEIYAGKGMAYSCGGVRINGVHYATGSGLKRCTLSNFSIVLRLI